MEKKRQPEMAFLNRLGLQDTPEFCGYSSYLHWYPHTSDAPKYCLPALSFWDQVSVLSVPDIENRRPERLALFQNFQTHSSWSLFDQY